MSALSLLSACSVPTSPPPPPTGAPVTEVANTKSASIGVRGGRVTTTASNGVTYSLIVPPEALKETVNITLTPISSMGNAPLSAGVTDAVQMEPSGLNFKRTATLRIGMASRATAGKRLVGFGTASDGTKFVLKLPRVKPEVLELNINHFSNAGVGNASDAEIAGVPDLAPLTNAPTSSDFNDQIDLAVTVKSTDQVIAAYFETWFAEIVKPALLAAENSSGLDKIIDAELIFEKWFDARVSVAESSEGNINVEPFLTDEDVIARPIVAKLLLLEFPEN